MNENGCESKALDVEGARRSFVYELLQFAKQLGAQTQKYKRRARDLARRFGS